MEPRRSACQWIRLLTAELLRQPSWVIKSRFYSDENRNYPINKSVRGPNGPGTFKDELWASFELNVQFTRVAEPFQPEGTTTGKTE